MRMTNPDIDLSTTKENLKKIYSIRSTIAHGNFGELSKIINSAKKKKDLDQQYLLDTITSKLYIYMKEVVKAYLIDKEFVEFLKQA